MELNTFHAYSTFAQTFALKKLAKERTKNLKNMMSNPIKTHKIKKWFFSCKYLR